MNWSQSRLSSEMAKYLGPLMDRLNAAMRFAGTPGTVGLCVMIMSALMWWAFVRPNIQQLDQLSAPPAVLGTASMPRAASVNSNALKEYKSLLPDRARHAAQIGEVFRHAQAARLNVISIEHQLDGGASEQATTYPAIQVRLDATGQHSAAADFIRRIVTGMPNAALDRLSMRRGKSSDDVFQVEMRVLLYVQPQ